MTRRFVTAATLMMAISHCLVVSAGPKVVIGQPVLHQNRVGIDQANHADWHRLLQSYVDAEGNVAYMAWKNSSRDINALDQYLNGFSYADRRQAASTPTRIAFWINAYNALTIKGILREYPTTSIRNHTAEQAGYNVWKDLLLTVGDERLSLEDIEHKILRKMGEPRIHFAIVCASHGCPRLLNEAYQRETLNVQLRKNATHFFSDHENLRFDSRTGTLEVSSILKWFGEDFGKNQNEQLAAIMPYVPLQVATAIRTGQIRQVSYAKYDWRLNDLATAPQRRRLPAGNVQSIYRTAPIVQTGFHVGAGGAGIGAGINLERACTNCQSGNHSAASAEIRKAAAYVRGLARSGKKRSKAALESSARELDHLAEEVEGNRVKSTMQLKSTFARTHHALAVYHQELLDQSPRADARQAATNVKAAAGHLSSAVFWSGKTIGSGTARFIEKSRRVGEDVAESTGTVAESVGTTAAELGGAVEDVANILVFPGQ